MSDEKPKVDPVTKVARDLTEIENLATHLASQAISRANDRLMPGGRAMVALARDADLEEWSEQIAAAELRHYAGCDKESHRDCTVSGAEHVEDEDDQYDEDPLRTLLFWSEAWREEHGYPLDGRAPTLSTETGFLRHMLNWAWDNEPHFADFARDVNRTRLRLENLLYAGRRVERTRVHCAREGCESKPRLILIRARRQVVDGLDDELVTEDYWKCPACKARYDRDAYNRAFAQQLRSEGAERYVKIGDAIGTLRAQGRSERTIRKWFGECQVEAYCDPVTHETWVWWPDLWRLHLATQTRNRGIA